MSINDVSLTAGMRSNLVALQGTVDLLNRTQERLSTGKKVNTALDNPLNFFTAKSLNSRAADLAGYKDGMSEAVQTIKAANAGISGIEGLLAQAKAVAATAKAGTEGTGGGYSNSTIDLVCCYGRSDHQCRRQTYTAVARIVTCRKRWVSPHHGGDTITIGTSDVSPQCDALHSDSATLKCLQSTGARPRLLRVIALRLQSANAGSHRGEYYLQAILSRTGLVASTVLRPVAYCRPLSLHYVLWLIHGVLCRRHQYTGCRESCSQN